MTIAICGEGRFVPAIRRRGRMDKRRGCRNREKSERIGFMDKSTIFHRVFYSLARPARLPIPTLTSTAARPFACQMPVHSVCDCNYFALCLCLPELPVKVCRTDGDFDCFFPSTCDVEETPLDLLPLTGHSIGRRQSSLSTRSRPLPSGRSVVRSVYNNESKHLNI